MFLIVLLLRGQLTDLLWRGQHSVSYCSALEGAAQCFSLICFGRTAQHLPLPCSFVVVQVVTMHTYQLHTICVGAVEAGGWGQVETEFVEWRKPNPLVLLSPTPISCSSPTCIHVIVVSWFSQCMGFVPQGLYYSMHCKNHETADLSCTD